MVHEMHLFHEPFIKIKDKLKTVEMRLCDEKRSRIQIGDIIKFIDTCNNEKMNCRVTNLYRYSDFEELYQNHDKALIGYDENDVANPSDMLVYYSAENIRKYGVLAIEIAVI